MTHYNFKGKDYYICAILDLFARKVAAYKIGFRENTHLTKATFLIAVNNRQPAPGLIFHSDQGPGYRSVREFYVSVKDHIERDNSSRPHQNLHYKTLDVYEAAYYVEKRLFPEQEQ